ncbi:MAG: hypothetical protein ACUVX1_14455 [Chloroflexota bacterium]
MIPQTKPEGKREVKLPGDFSPERYVTKLQGRDYLEVKWRLVWLRTEHPDAVITTELIQCANDFALFRATVSIPGAGSATGWGSETPKDFRDYIEKAETKALGRALAALGYGTQFCEDYAEGTGKVVDSPVSRSDGEPKPTKAQQDAAVTHWKQQFAKAESVEELQAIGRTLAHDPHVGDARDLLVPEYSKRMKTLRGQQSEQVAPTTTA